MGKKKIRALELLQGEVRGLGMFTSEKTEGAMKALL